jgi:hypothetical protein
MKYQILNIFTIQNIHIELKDLSLKIPPKRQVDVYLDGSGGENFTIV